MLTQSLGELFCQTASGSPCGPLVAHVTAPVAPTGRSLIDLMGIDEVVVQHPADAAKFAAWAGAAWTEARGPAGEWRFARNKPLGLITWASPGVAARIASREPARIGAEVRNDGPGPGTIVLARAWYPGWSARLNGASVAARPFAGLLVSVQLPPHSAGRLEVSFWPAGLTAGFVLAAVGVMLIALAALFPARLDAAVARLAAILPKRKSAVAA
jgi:hypothetical protein